MKELNYLDITKTGQGHIKVPSATGIHPDFTAGAAEQIISDDYTENKVPYLLRASGGNGSKREEDTLVGGTVAFNQLVDDGNFTDSTKWEPQVTGATVTLSGGVATVTYNSGTASATRPALKQTASWQAIAGHKYLLSIDLKASKTLSTAFFRSTTLGNMTSFANVGTEWQRFEVVKNATSSGNGVAYIGNNGSESMSVGDSISFRNYCVYDLTQMFGSTIADYIYSLEQATAGAGVAWFKALFPKPYYAYNAGELMSVSGVSEHKMVGFNAWDEEWELGAYDGTTGAKVTNTTNLRSKNAIPVLPNTAYYAKSPYAMYVFEYDASGNFIGYTTWLNSVLTTGANTHFVRFYMLGSYGTTYKGDICINLSSSRNGEYEPYKAMSYPLDDSLTLRGISKLDANNNLYYDGDTYESDGTVTRKYGIVDLGTLAWFRHSDGYFYSSTLAGIAANSTDTMNSKGLPPRSSASGDRIYTGWNGTIYAFYSAASTAAEFKTAMNGVYLLYVLATPTTEQADPYTNPQNVDPNGTEEYVSTSIVPVGHETKYFADLVERIASIPEPPTANGTYRLIATVSGGVATLSWVAN